MQCLFCGSELEEQLVDFEERVDDLLCSVVQAPAQSCPACGERYIPGWLLAAIEQVARREQGDGAHRRIQLTAPMLSQVQIDS